MLCGSLDCTKKVDGSVKMERELFCFKPRPFEKGRRIPGPPSRTGLGGGPANVSQKRYFATHKSTGGQIT
jgi:hypothetical protein